MTVTTEGVSTAGEMFSLVCTVETVEGVSPENIFITWIGPNGTIPTGDNIMIGNISNEGWMAMGWLMFSPLLTSNRGQYNCTGGISNVGTNVSNVSSVKINITSKWC